MTTFTFQSGYIQIQRYTSQLHYHDLYIPIWLYSNHTTICDYSVIFIFTFQSGYIQIVCKFVIGAICSVFTFQSGYIQIFIKKGYWIVCNNLYIPIWLYSNDAYGVIIVTGSNFTFQSGYIQIKLNMLNYYIA